MQPQLITLILFAVGSACFLIGNLIAIWGLIK